MKRLIFALLLCSFLPLSLIAQSINKEEAVSKQSLMLMAKNTSKYQLNRLYNVDNYQQSFENPFNPVICGVSSAIIPGLGQILCGEYVNGLGFLSSIALAEGISYGVSKGISQTPKRIMFKVAMTGLISFVYIWGIIDAVKTAKLKDMYYQDLCEKNGIELSLLPDIQFNSHIPGQNQTVGLNLCLKF